jgi:c-di-GMP-binding flagellar brake protein YcgR
MFQDTRPAEPGADGAGDGWAEFRVSDRAERLSLLGRLRDAATPVQLSSPSGAVLTSQLWAMDPQQMQLSFSAGGGSLPMQQLAQGDEAVAVAYLDSVKLQFDLADLMLVHRGRSCALRTRLPELMYRFQRRAGFRVRSLDRHAPKAELRHPSMPDMRLTLRIVDLSVGGCAIVLPRNVPPLQPGTSLRGVRIALGVDTAFAATLRLQHVATMHGESEGLRLGCEFVEIDGAARRSLQRYIDHTQQRRRLLSPR